MKSISPIHSTTKVIDKHLWRPLNLITFLDEINNLQTNKKENSLYLYRGHASANWILDSTFVRYYKRKILQMPESIHLKDSIRNSEEYNNVITWFYLFKFGVLARPSTELLELAESDEIDPWFELKKRMQQFPDEDHPEVKGTNILDWTKSYNIALYFANDGRNGDGALWIYDSPSTGKILQTITVGEILDKMRHVLKKGKSWGTPLFFHPKKQIKCKQANNQEAIYIAQMDLRYSLDELWSIIEKENKNDELIYMKIIIPAGSENDLSNYLTEKGITTSFIYPDN